eukprot:CAMPEP_0182926776 /NCGR_PEP_ID=MMETSP0105_2-20130417/12258_1 /TAXON_ID=81532 ORGANISM="Acanthoeca-like sp., Strain 10tr" /NCGR_SAMPLE_ID=MMETSP0105_2 /ASSEMBLY_ACC=CAM_ASM_000205 /LENGTH=306 /DNA_ID=CAMNT_0025064685 /DNA_START=46 /DNA_END=966 /DNA_ORIENTATION=-
MSKGGYELDAAYGKQSVPVFKVLKGAGGRHDVLDMVVQLMLRGEVSLSWTAGDNGQIVPTETQKNTCFAIALQHDFTSPEEYAIILGSDLLARHKHLASVTIDVSARMWKRHSAGGVPHDHVFTSSPAPPKTTCHVVVSRDGPTRVRSGVAAMRLMKTTASGFAGFIKDKYTDLQPVGAGSANPDRIMCTEMTATWDYRSSAKAPDYAVTNAAIARLLAEQFAGPVPGGVFSKSLQETVYRMGTQALGQCAEIDAIEIITPNVHFYPWEGGKFGLDNPNVVFRSTEPDTTASGRIYTRLTRGTAKL